MTDCDEKRRAAKKLIEWLEEGNDIGYIDFEPFHFRDYDGSSYLINERDDDKKQYIIKYDDDGLEYLINEKGEREEIKYYYQVGNVKPDIVMCDKSNESYYVYFNTPSFSPKEKQEYMDCRIKICVMDVKWILKQEKKPVKLKYKLIVEDYFSSNHRIS